MPEFYQTPSTKADSAIPNPDKPRAKILVVDDQPINVQLLRHTFERENMKIITAYSGQECIEKVRQERPDIILLDVMMPGMDGIEVCQRLKQSIDFKTIPIIFISARSSKEGRLEGLDSGAVDYITKPIDIDETMARVRTQLRVIDLNRQNAELQRQLAESRHAATISAITRGLAHNLNNLLGVTVGYVDLISTFYANPELVAKNVVKLDAAMTRIVEIIRQISYISVDTQLPMSTIGLRQLLENANLRYQQEYKVAQPAVIQADPEALVQTNTEAMEDAIARILINAWESYNGKSAARPITLSGEIGDNNGNRLMRVTIEDSGRGIDPSIRDTIFEPFTSTKQTVGIGMGLPIARHYLRNLSGSIDIENRPEGGTRVILSHKF